MYTKNNILQVTNSSCRSTLRDIRDMVLNRIMQKTGSDKIVADVDKYLDANRIMTPNPVGNSSAPTRFHSAYVKQVLECYSEQYKGVMDDFLNGELESDNRYDVNFFSEGFIALVNYLLPEEYELVYAFLHGADYEEELTEACDKLYINCRIYESDYVDLYKSNIVLSQLLNEMKSSYATGSYIKKIVGSDTNGSVPGETATSDHDSIIKHMCSLDYALDKDVAREIAQMRENYEKLSDTSLSDDERTKLACDWAEAAVGYILLTGSYDD